MGIKFHLHPHVEWKVVKYHVTAAGAVVGMFAGLWFLGVCWNTYTEAVATYNAMELTMSQPHVRAVSEVKKNE